MIMFYFIFIYVILFTLPILFVTYFFSPIKALDVQHIW